MENIQLDHSHHYTQNKTFPVCFLAHDIDVPMNIGSLFRIADALGIEKIYLSGTSLVPPNTKIRKTSRATEKFVPFSYDKNPLDIVKKLKSEGYMIVSLEITSSSIDISELSLSGNEKVCLVLGSERSGVCQELLDVSDVTIHITMMGRNSSMNVASACSIATYEIIRRYLP
ncbi:MAG: TrmH family RNA methyltransferase [Candidatus Thiodiazotropha sp. (ex Dulcina madagascariensis)]|nr:TrmH family RNA methyltransferase [Candidatus Thiodiazotropha sp. (ex Dulcina madagascariensis)]